jgi:membrane-bound lytic murein transglycosylase D
MMKLRRLLVLGVTSLLVGCGANVRPATAPPSSVSLPFPVQDFTALNVPKAALSVDPTAAAIAIAEAEFAAGERQLALGHREAARDRFDAAVDGLLSMPGGARRDARLEAAYDRLIDRIGAYEIEELRAGDGFSESRSEPAVIDNLLAASTTGTPVAPRKTTAELVADDLDQTPHDIPIKINDKVLGYVERFQGNLRNFIEDGLQRGAQYLPMIQDVFQAEGVPLDLAFVPLIESAFKPTALSRAAAKGMWQFGAATGREAGLEQNWFLDERSDPEKATLAAAQYLKTLHKMFDRDWDMALAAYNAGMGRVQRAAKLARTDDYWTLTSTNRYLPRETREYVPMILAAIVIARNPVQYGFEINLVEPLAYDTVKVPDALRLETVAEWIDVPVERIKSLNPELRRGMTPIGQHELKVPAGTSPVVERQLASASPSVFASASFLFHTVKKGETLTTIARRYKLARVKLADANDLKTTARVSTGTRLMVPTTPAPALASRAKAPKPTAVASAAVASNGTSGTSTYRVKPGDTLYRIARQFDTSVASLKKMNRLSSDALDIGDRLTVPR